MSSSNTTSQASFGEFIGALVGMGINLVKLSLTVLIEAVTMLFGYSSLQSSFFLIGAEQKPLSEDPLLGQWLGDFFGSASLSGLGAVVVVSVIAVGSYLIAEQVMEWRRYSEQGAAYRQELAYAPTGNAEIRAIAERAIDTCAHKIQDSIVIICIIGTLLTGVVVWDMDLAVYRGLAGAYGFSEGDPEAPGQAIHTIQTLSIELEKHGDLFAWDTVPLMAIGLVCCMGLIPFGIEYYFYRVAAQAQRFAFAGQLLAGAAWRAIAGDYDGGGQVPAVTATANSAPQANFTEPAVFVPPVQEDLNIHEPHPVEPETLKAVIGADVLISVAEARRSPELYWVDTDTHDIWDAEYRRRLMGEGR